MMREPKNTNGWLRRVWRAFTDAISFRKIGNRPSDARPTAGGSGSRWDNSNGPGFG